MKRRISLFLTLLAFGTVCPGFTLIVEAATSSGTVVAWGENDYGEVTGAATLTSPFSATANPVILNGQTLSEVTAIAGGGAHTLALKSDGTVVAWGYDAQGQTNGMPTTPTDTYGGEATANPVTLNGQILTGVTAISAGFYHSVALMNDCTLVAWGDNSEGQTTVPAGLSGVTAIAAGVFHTVALKSDGTVVAWGSNSLGQTTIPVDLTGVIAIAASGSHTIALKSDGTVAAWGQNTRGEVTGTPTSSHSGFATANPVTLDGQILSGVIAVAAAGEAQTLALKSDGTVVAWGSDVYGETTGTPTGLSAIANPVTLNGQILSGVTAITAGFSHSVALKSDGTVVAWGAGGAGQSGDPNYGQADVPAGLTGVTAIAAGGYHTVALVPAPNNTPAGSNVIVNIGAIGSAAIILTFPQVTVDGTTTVMLIDPSSAGTLPSGYQLAGGNLAFEITTTAAYTTPPPIIVAFQMASIDAATFSQLRVLHNEGGTLVDRTASDPAPTTQTIYASVSSLSPFVIAKLATPTNMNQCKNGGWQKLSRTNGTRFKNQGDCIQYVNTGK
jgi:hypothetical protein